MKKIILYSVLSLFLIFLTGMLSSCSEYPITSPIEQEPKFGIFRIAGFSGRIINGDTVRVITIYCNGKIEKEIIIYYNGKAEREIIY